jgi:ankyrin repeat protein
VVIERHHRMSSSSSTQVVAANPFIGWIRNDDMENLDAALSFPAGAAPLSSRLNERHPDVEDGETPLGLAVAMKNLPLVALLLSHGADANVNSRAGCPPLLRTGHSSSDEGMITSLLKSKADPNRSGADGKTPLIAAAADGAINIITLLLASGADPSRIDPTTGYTALLTAIRTATSTARATELLTAFGLMSSTAASGSAGGIDHQFVDAHGHTILHHCVLNRLYYAIEPLLSHGSHPNFATKQTGRFDHLCSEPNGSRVTAGGRTALHLASRSNEAKLLLLAGGLPSVRDESGRSSVDYARANAAWTSTTASGSTAATDADALLQLLLAFGSPDGGGMAPATLHPPPPLSITPQTSDNTSSSGSGVGHGHGAPETPFSPSAPLFSPAGVAPITPATGPAQSPASPTTPFQLTTPAHPSMRPPSSFHQQDSNAAASATATTTETSLLSASIASISSSSSDSTTSDAPTTREKPKRSVMFADPDEPAVEKPATPDFGPVAAHVGRHQRNITVQLEDLGPPGPDDGPHSTRKRKLHVAALGGRLEAVKALIKSGWSVNAATDNGIHHS